MVIINLFIIIIIIIIITVDYIIILFVHVCIHNSVLLLICNLFWSSLMYIFPIYYCMCAKLKPPVLVLVPISPLVDMNLVNKNKIFTLDFLGELKKVKYLACECVCARACDGMLVHVRTCLPACVRSCVYNTQYYIHANATINIPCVIDLWHFLLTKKI